MKQPLAVVILVIYAMVINSRAAAQSPAIPATAQVDTSAIPREEIKKVLEAKDGEDKEGVYLEVLAKYPPEKFGTNYLPYDQARQRVALGFAHANNVSKALQYLSLVEDR